MIVYGRNSVDEALEENLSIKEVVVEKGKEEKFENLLRRIKAKGIPVRNLPLLAMDKYAQSQKHQGIAADLSLPPNVVEEGGENEDWTKYTSILALDGITDTGNLGAIVRSASLFGFEAIVLPNDNSARITPQTIRSSAGAIYKQRILYVNNINTVIEVLKAEEFFIYGLAAEAEKSIVEIEFAPKVCLVIGSEREGIRKSVKKKCDSLIKIPTTRRIDSLNASVASAIAMWEVTRRK